jgi:hypothetical protein
VSWDAVIGAAAGIISGLFAGVFSAGIIAWKTAVTADRYRATVTIRGILVSFRAQLLYDEQRDFAASLKPKSFVDAHHRQAMAIEVMAQTGALSSGKARRIRAGLAALLGPTSLGYAERRVFLPNGFVDDDADNTQQALQLLTEMHKNGGADFGLFGDVYASQGVEDKRRKLPTLVATFDQLIGEVS